ncbi:MAG TPA: DUF523 and DUF1722 domain-containing protein [Thermoanaerobaculia bacterium]|nr:DUF523 and DUF1722 domain-containing protein [Thermoanaerobaculia bacterium]
MVVPGPAKLRLGVSACLLGQEVRYNGGHKRDRFLTDVLGPYVDWVPVCPEVELGLGTPRPALRLVRIGGGTRLITPETATDWTEPMREYAERRVAELAGLELAGYVLKKDSPSCGMERVKLYREEEGSAPLRDGRGLFAEVLLERLPALPVEEEGRLADPAPRENFVSRIFAYDRFRRQERQGFTRAGLLRFHEHHKFLLMARNQAGMRRLGRLLGSAGREVPMADLTRDYLAGFTAVLSRPASRRGHTNVLQHLAGYVSDPLERADREELTQAIESYRQGYLPLIVPLTLLRHHARRQEVAYLEDQVYLWPHPSEMMLFNHV